MTSRQRVCARSWPLRAKPAGLAVHLCGRSPVCLRVCISSSDGDGNAAAHVVHTCEPLTPKCTRRTCLYMFDSFTNAFAQWVHLCARSFTSRPLCLSCSCECFACVWRTSVLRCAKAAPHTEHTNGRSPVCVRTCTVKCDFDTNDA
jgi:hypothetical protein